MDTVGGGEEALPKLIFGANPKLKKLRGGCRSGGEALPEMIFGAILKLKKLHAGSAEG